MAFHDDDDATSIGVAAMHRGHMAKPYRSRYRPNNALSARERQALDKGLQIREKKRVTRMYYKKHARGIKATGRHQNRNS